LNKLVRASGIEPLTPTMSRWVCMRRKSLISLKLTTLTERRFSNFSYQ
jgi:hypothetical protein